jgi:PKD repeat protein
VAVINAAPISGPPPLVVHFDAARSFAQTDAILMRYQWDLGDGSQAQGSQIDHIYGRKGAYQVRLIVTDDHGRSGTAGITISVGDLAPHAKIVASPPDGPAPLAVTFDGSGSTGPTDGPNAGVIVTYHWDFGDGTDADGVQPSHLYMRGGRFTATLTVTGAAGLADRASVDIRVLSFTKRPSQPVGRQPVAVVAADLDGDGRLDLAVANIASNDISILIQQPDGAFDQLGNIPVRHAPSSLVVADFDDDGIPDIASGSFETGEVSLVLGAGAGRFQPLRVFPAATAITALAVGDFNGDGHLDLAVADGPGSRVAILLGDGKGGFASPKYFPAGRWPSALIVGDFNGDGHLDLAVADFFGNTVSILLGDGKGNFSEPVETAVGAGPVSLATGDFDRDGRLDLAVANSSDGTLSILFGSGAGHFNQRLTIPVGSQVRSVVAADLNGDGRLDLIAANGGDDTISILLGDGNGSFPAAGQLLLHADGTPSGIAVGDFNRDGFPDFAVIRFGASAVTLFQNDL